jgi:formylmethanofuran dehydrogenase subunit B
MPEFKVSIYERMTHTITVDDINEDAAIEKAYQLISNISETLLWGLHDYELDGEYTGVHEAEELPAD